MATPNLTDPDQRDDQLNPGQTHYDREFNRGTPRNDAADAERSKLNDRENSAGVSDSAPTHSPAQKEESWATNIAKQGAATAAQAAGVKVPFLTKKRGGVIGAVVAVIITIISLIGLVFPNFAIVNLKEVAVNKFIKDQLAVYEPRSGIIMRKKVTPSAPETSGCVIKVKCRFKGVSQKGIDKLERAGFKIQSQDISGHPLRYKRITSITYSKGGRDINVTPEEYNRAIRTDPEFRKMLNQAYKSRYALYADTMARKITNKLGIWRGNQLGDAKDKKELRQKFRKSMLGRKLDISGRVIADESTDNKEQIESRQRQLGEIGANVDEEAAKLLDDYNDPDKVISSIPDVNSPDMANVGKSVAQGAAKGAILGPIAIADSACTIYYMISAVGFGSKVIANEQLIRFYYTFSNTADAIKAGDATPQQVSFLGEMMSSKDKQGKTFADSYGYNYMAYGNLGKASDTFKYKLGGGLTGDLIGIKSTLDQFATNKTCAVVTNPFVQGLSFIGYIAGTIFSGGSLSGASIAGSVAISSAVGIATAVAEPILIRLVAGTLITGDENGKDVGNAFAAGGGAHAATSARNRGLVPLTKQEAIAYNAHTESVFASAMAAERIEAHPLDISNPASPAGMLFARIAPVAAAPYSQSSLGSFAQALNPVSLLGSAVNNLNPTAKAAAAADEYEVCTDPEYQEMNLATDPFCNVKYGFDPAKVTGERYDPDRVIDYMLANDLIDTDGNPKGEYATFITDCLESDKPLSPGGDGEYAMKKDCFEKRNEERHVMMRLYFLDTTIYEGMQEQMDDTRLDATPVTTPPPATSTSSASGDRKELAQRILDSGRVTGDARYMKQIRDVAAGNYGCNINPRILQLILDVSTRHTVYITSLNRYCTGVTTKSGTGSYHYRDGGGHAVDFGMVDNVRSTGNTAKDRELLNFIIPGLPSGSQIGQVNCRSSNPISTPPGVRQVNDTCNHVHISVPVQ